MTLRVLLATLHLLALGIGLGAVWTRARLLSARPLDVVSARRAFVADAWWGIAAGLWIATGLWRLFASIEKPASYYMQNHVFLMKMGFLVLILILEVWPMIMLARWRRDSGRNRDSWRPDESAAGRIVTISYVEAALVIAMVIAATAMVRGVGA